ncbi:MAG: tRNA pseudouridine(38-40) synthase TruA [Nitrospirota bacterium]
MPRLRLTLEYDGTDYHGWQRQASAATIQGVLEAAITRISGERAAVSGAGRTDAGVHAEAQVAHVEIRSALDPHTWHRALNAVLPEDVKILAVEHAPAGFHARFSAVGKRYRYRLLNRPTPSPLERRTSWHVPRPLNLAAMRRAAAALLGRHDFRAFEGADPTHGDARDTVCTLARCAIRRQDQIVALEFEGDRFLKYMVRNIVGTLVEIGLGRRPAGGMAEVLASGDRRLAGITAPAHGLTLVEVYYPRPRHKRPRSRRT